MSLGLTYKDDMKVFKENEKNGVPYLTYPLLEETGIVVHGFSTRLGGVSKGCWSTMNLSTSRGDDPAAVEENTRRMAAALGVDAADMTYTQQIHSTHVSLVRSEDKGKTFMETDGLITDVPGICLVTFYADCVPLYFVDPEKKVIALSHSGWKGTVGKMGEVTVRKMTASFGCDPADIVAAIGPSICQDCYEVSEDVIEQFRAAFDESLWPQIFAAGAPGKYQLNLWEANRQVLLGAGILPEHLAVTNLCTHCNPDLLFSHRAMGNKRGNLSAFLALKEA